jgi:hypothetical protein
MCVWVNPTGHNQFAARVDDLRLGYVNISAYHGDNLAFYQNVGNKCFCSGDEVPDLIRIGMA